MCYLGKIIQYHFVAIGRHLLTKLLVLDTFLRCKGKLNPLEVCLKLTESSNVVVGWGSCSHCGS